MFGTLVQKGLQLGAKHIKGVVCYICSEGIACSTGCSHAARCADWTARRDGRTPAFSFAGVSHPETLYAADDGALLGPRQPNNTSLCAGGELLHKHWLLFLAAEAAEEAQARMHAHTATFTASSMCYFANCSPGQDNKMASRHVVNISVLAECAPGWPAAH